MSRDDKIFCYERFNANGNNKRAGLHFERFLTIVFNNEEVGC